MGPGPPSLLLTSSASRVRGRTPLGRVGCRLLRRALDEPAWHPRCLQEANPGLCDPRSVFAHTAKGGSLTRLASLRALGALLSAPVKSNSIWVAGTCTTVNGKPAIEVDGVTVGFKPGKTVIQYIRISGGTSYSEGTARPAITDSHGPSMRRRETGNELHIYVTSDHGAAQFNRVITWPTDTIGLRDVTEPRVSAGVTTTRPARLQQAWTCWPPPCESREPDWFWGTQQSRTRVDSSPQYQPLNAATYETLTS